MKKALLVLDFINDIVHEEGSIGKDGYYHHEQEQQAVANTAKAIEAARRMGMPVLYVVVGFSPGYPEWNDRSKLFRPLKEKGQLVLGTWATQVHDALQPMPGEYVVTKNRIDPFYNTNLEIMLRNMEIDTLYLTGVSTEFVILSTTLSGHDRGYVVRPLEDCISSSDAHSHACAMNVIEKLADVYTLEQFMAEEGVKL
ncbi:cysteine hydrolase [Tumebacillus sp. DT12]|uniref:Cysteine hydrolase n=1 Tax=Tumebacillus lacus TaxID=2995335 RepID=A0ABT3X823_9BACL|nr:cysteine hydrolase [Tumebacillus lacus]MCX7570904.1 cysteine hydrolase [Tumebacillus lacus]